MKTSIPYKSGLKSHWSRFKRCRRSFADSKEVEKRRTENASTSPDVQGYRPSQASRDPLESFAGTKPSRRSLPLSPKEEGVDPERIEGLYTDLESGAGKDAHEEDEEDKDVAILPSLEQDVEQDVEQEIKAEDRGQAGSQFDKALPSLSKKQRKAYPMPQASSYL